MLEAQESAGSSNQALQKELETARVEWAKCEVQILHLEDEKRKLTAERDSRRRLEHIVMVYLWCFMMIHDKLLYCDVLCLIYIYMFCLCFIYVSYLADVVSSLLSSPGSEISGLNEDLGQPCSADHDLH
jgi:hypothetical protein